MNRTSIVAVTLDDVELREDPIDPAWIREGERPQAVGADHDDPGEH